MLVKMKNGRPVQLTEELSEDQLSDRSWKCNWDWRSFEEVQSVARYLTAMTGKTYLAIDAGAHVSPRFRVIVARAVGDEVSYGFNGDSYPDGTIVKITKNFTITTSTGRTYRRKGDTAGWYQPGGTWGLIQGHHYEQNPHF